MSGSYVNIDLSGASAAVAQMKKRLIKKSKFREKVAYITKYLAERANAIVEAKIAFAPSEAQSAEEMAEIKCEMNAQNNYFYRISANGRAICFIEFGAGVGAREDAIGRDKFGFYEDSWSKTHKGVYAKQGWWYSYKDGQQIDAQTASKPFGTAAEWVRENLERIAQEVFGSGRY